MENQQNQTYRMALRSFQCRSCQNQFRQMVNVAHDNGYQAQCTFCSSNQVLEIESAQELQVNIQRPTIQLPSSPSITLAPTAVNGQIGMPEHTQAQETTNQQAPSPRPQVMQVMIVNGVETHTTISNGFTSDGRPFTQEVRVMFYPIPTQTEQQPRASGSQIPPQVRTFQMFFPFFAVNPQQEVIHATDPQFIEQIPKAISCDGKECYICLEKLEDPQVTAQLPCGHCFDRSCINKWLQDHNKCPVCRHELPQKVCSAPTQPSFQDAANVFGLFRMMF